MLKIMKKILLLISFLFFNISYSQVINFECDNTVISVSWEEIVNNPNAYMDWDEDGDIDEVDAIIYLYQAYDCGNNGDDGNDWDSVFISLNADSEEINEIGFEIYDCEGTLYLAAGAPYEGYTELPNDFTIVMVDYAGDGWNEGSNMYIDGYGEYSLETGFYDTISNCDGDDGNDWGDNMDCEEGTALISVNGGAWMDEVYWTITTCDGQEIIAEGGAPYNNCISLPDNYVINMFDSFGDGWNGNIMTIGDVTFSFESCAENVIAVGDCNIDWWGGDDSDCENIDFWNDVIWDDSDWDDFDWGNNGDGIDDFDWDNNGDGIDDFNWDDFDWTLVWDDYNLGDVDWENTPWDVIIDLFINPEDLINYLDEVIFRQLFNWNDFIEYFIENNSSLNLENNSSIGRYIVKTVNIMGQNVNNNFDGVILYMYNDGSIERKYFIK